MKGNGSVAPGVSGMGLVHREAPPGVGSSGVVARLSTWYRTGRSLQVSCPLMLACGARRAPRGAAV
jgi:hypothetical protein